MRKFRADPLREISAVNFSSLRNIFCHRKREGRFTFHNIISTYVSISRKEGCKFYEKAFSGELTA